VGLLHMESEEQDRWLAPTSMNISEKITLKVKYRSKACALPQRGCFSYPACSVPNRFPQQGSAWKNSEPPSSFATIAAAPTLFGVLIMWALSLVILLRNFIAIQLSDDPGRVSKHVKIQSSRPLVSNFQIVKTTIKLSGFYFEGF